MTRKFRKFIALESGYRHLLLRAWIQLGLMKARLSRRTFQSLVVNLDHHPQEMHRERVDRHLLDRAREIGWAVQTAARHTPWESACLVQALAAQSMLNKAAIPGVLYLGALIDRSVSEEDNPLSAHAWIRCGDAFIVGEAGHDRFTVVSAFSW